jgi:hypothetical protein
MDRHSLPSASERVQQQQLPPNILLLTLAPLSRAAFHRQFTR